MKIHFLNCLWIYKKWDTMISLIQVISSPICFSIFIWLFTSKVIIHFSFHIYDFFFFSFVSSFFIIKLWPQNNSYNSEAFQNPRQDNIWNLHGCVSNKASDQHLVTSFILHTLHQTILWSTWLGIRRGITNSKPYITQNPLYS